MDIVYLQSGQEANLVRKIDDESFLVEPLQVVENYEGEESLIRISKVVVEKVFKKPPLDKIQKDYLKVFDKIEAKNKELRQITAQVHKAGGELRELETAKSKTSKMIYDRSVLIAAKRITVFPKDKINPTDLEDRAIKGLKIAIEFNVRRGEEKRWVTKLYDDYGDCSTYLDPDYDFLIDMTDDQILEISRKRAQSKPNEFFDRGTLRDAKDIYLPEKQILLKREFESAEKITKAANLEKKIKDLTDQLEALK